MANATRLLRRIVFFLLLLLYGAHSYKCPGDYDFPQCPRPDIDGPELDTCCTKNNVQQCCTSSEALETWAIWLISIAVIAFVVVVGILICCCCGWCVCLVKTCECCFKCLCCCCGDDDDENTKLMA